MTRSRAGQSEASDRKALVQERGQDTSESQDTSRDEHWEEEALGRAGEGREGIEEEQKEKCEEKKLGAI